MEVSARIKVIKACEKISKQVIPTLNDVEEAKREAREALEGTNILPPTEEEIEEIEEFLYGEGEEDRGDHAEDQDGDVNMFPVNNAG